MPREGDIDPQNPEKSKDHQCIDISRGGRSTKTHAVVDALGNPIHIQLSAGNVNDVTVTQDVLSHVNFRGSTILLKTSFLSSKSFVASPLATTSWHADS